MTKEMVWTSATGLKTNIANLNHQYLSNIIWFNEVFHGVNRNDRVQFELLHELERRFDGSDYFGSLFRYRMKSNIYVGFVLSRIMGISQVIKKPMNFVVKLLEILIIENKLK